LALVLSALATAPSSAGTLSSVSPGGAWLGAVTYVFSGVSVSESFYPHIQPGMTLLPWILWQLRRARDRSALAYDRLVVVDRNPACLVSAFPSIDLEVRAEEWRVFFRSYLAGEARDGDAIVPSPLMPHLLFQWLEERAIEQGAHLLELWTDHETEEGLLRALGYMDDWLHELKAR
jgi:hypothetical protein